MSEVELYTDRISPVGLGTISAWKDANADRY
jgi:hypothetical protein